MAPDRIAPAMPLPGLLGNYLFIEFDPQSRSPRDLHITVRTAEYAGVCEVIEQVAALIVMDPQALFLNKGVVADGVNLQAGSQSDRTQWTMRGQSDVVCFRHSGDLPALGYAAGMGEIRLDNIHRTAFKHPFEVEAAEQPLSSGDRDIAVPADLDHLLQVLGEDRFLYEHQFELFEFAGDDAGHRLVHPAVKIDTDIEIGTAAVADSGDPGHQLVDFLVAVDYLHLSGAVHLYRRGPIILRFEGGLADIRGPVAANPLVDPDGVTTGSAHEVMNRRIVVFSFDIPERLIDSRERAHQDRSTPVKGRPVEFLPDILNPGGITPHHIVHHFMDGRLDRVGLPFNDRLPPADETVVRLNFQKQPARGNYPCGISNYFHSFTLPMSDSPTMYFFNTMIILFSHRIKYVYTDSVTNVNKKYRGKTVMNLIALDWGTTSLRGYLVDVHGKILEKTSSAEGILSIPDSRFSEALARLLDSFSKKTADCPIIASGMITSRQGWLETPYVECPVSASDLARQLQPLKTNEFGTVWFVPGVKQYQPEPDIMRGEETQLAGLGKSARTTTLLPGTHSKWVELENGLITRFTTFMTGDLYSAVRHGTILRALAATEWSAESFHEGVETGYGETRSGKGLLTRLFQTRVKTILGLSQETANESYLSGLLIGTEIAEAIEDGYPGRQPLTIIGTSNLSELYATALNACSIKTITAPEDLAASGLYRIAKERQLI